MRSDSGRSVSPWMESTSTQPLQPLRGELRADVCVVGAGIAGMTTAWLLAREGRSVVVVDDGPIGGGETARTTAHLASALDDRYFELERVHGEKGARLAAESHSAAIDLIERTVAAERIACDFARLDGYLFAPPGEKPELLEREHEAARRAGLPVEWAPKAPFARFDTGRCLRFPRQGQIHPLHYLHGLAQAIARAGGRLFGDAHVVEFEGGANCHVRTEAGAVVRARTLVIATNVPVNDRLAVQTKQYPYRTYVIGARAPASAIQRALFWDTADPYHYVRRLDDDGGHETLVIVGGEDHRTGQADDAVWRYAALEIWMRERVPDAGAIDFRWSGQILEPADALAFIGRNPLDQDNVFIATGDSGNGMTHGTIAGLLLTDLIQGRENPWKELYDPKRRSLRTIGEFARENVASAAPYANWVKRADVKSVDEIAPDTGATIQSGLRKLAVFRRADGQLFELSAVCPHLGGIVEWNSSEKTWDCPCHGSRFAPDGHVVNGPACAGLERSESIGQSEKSIGRSESIGQSEESIGRSEPIGRSESAGA